MTPARARRKTSGSAVENIGRVVKRDGRRKRPSQRKKGEGCRAYMVQNVRFTRMARPGALLSDHVNCPIQCYTGLVPRNALSTDGLGTWHHNVERHGHFFLAPKI